MGIKNPANAHTLILVALLAFAVPAMAQGAGEAHFTMDLERAPRTALHAGEVQDVVANITRSCGADGLSQPDQRVRLEMLTSNGVFLTGPTDLMMREHTCPGSSFATSKLELTWDGSGKETVAQLIVRAQPEETGFVGFRDGAEATMAVPLSRELESVQPGVEEARDSPLPLLLPLALGVVAWRARGGRSA